MPERGARVRMPPVARLAIKGLQYFTWPLQIDDYLQLINPLWSTDEARGRIERIHPETDDAVTVFIVPGFRWRGHRPGQFLRIGFDIDGKRHWRAYSLSTDGSRPDGQITITVKRTEKGAVSNYLNSGAALGSLVTLGEVEGQFVCDGPADRKILFLTAGSGVTPVMAMLRSFERTKAVPDIVHIHSSRTASDAIFGEHLAALADSHADYRFELRETSTRGRLTPGELDDVCPDWRERQVFACGPGPMLDALTEHFDHHGLSDMLHIESFEHLVRGSSGAGGAIRFAASDVETQCDGDTVILDAGEAAGVDMPFGCRMGICHTCVGRLREGVVRDVRTGETTEAGATVRTCVNCPDGDVVIDL